MNAPVLVFAAGVGIRLAIAVAFWGSLDVDNQIFEGRALLEGRSVYGVTMGNKPALGYLVPAAMLLLAAGTGLPEYVAVKLPAIAGDVAAAALLGRLDARRSEPAWMLPALYLLNPATVLLSAYHGNVDPLMAALVLGAGALVSRGRSVAGGVSLGAAIALKQPAMLTLPVIALAARAGTRARLVVLAIVIPLAVTLPFAIADPSFARIFRYASVYGGWGIPLLLQQGTNVATQFGLAPLAIVTALSGLNDWLLAWGRAVVVAGLLAWYVAMFRRPREAGGVDLYRDIAATFLVFYIVASGFGVQYLAWALPFLFLASRRLALVYLAVVTPLLVGTYLQAALRPKYGVTSITAHLRLLAPEDLALVLANGAMALVAWATCAWIFVRIGGRRAMAR